MCVLSVSAFVVAEATDVTEACVEEISATVVRNFATFFYLLTIEHDMVVLAGSPSVRWDPHICGKMESVSADSTSWSVSASLLISRICWDCGIFWSLY